MRMPNDGSLDGFIMATDSRAVEVYEAASDSEVTMRRVGP